MKSKLYFIISVVISVICLFAITASADTEIKSIKENVMYYETSQKVGRSNTTDFYLAPDMTVVINGYSFLNDDNKILSFKCNPESNTIEIPEAPANSIKTMVHINSATNGMILGWTDIKNISDIETIDIQKAKKDSVNIANKVKADETIPQDSIILFDVSSSMDSYMSAVLSQLKALTENEIDHIYGFAKDVSDDIPLSEINDVLPYRLQYKLNAGATNVIKALELATKNYPNAHIYIISDFLNNKGKWGDISDKFTGKISLIQYEDKNSKNKSEMFIKQIYEHFPNAEYIER